MSRTRIKYIIGAIILLGLLLLSEGCAKKSRVAIPSDRIAKKSETVIVTNRPLADFGVVGPWIERLCNIEYPCVRIHL
jgi:hypothetical protein